jgi:hypothetical protein
MGFWLAVVALSLLLAPGLVAPVCAGTFGLVVPIGGQAGDIALDEGSDEHGGEDTMRDEGAFAAGEDRSAGLWGPEPWQVLGPERAPKLSSANLLRSSSFFPPSSTETETGNYITMQTVDVWQRHGAGKSKAFTYAC